MNPKGPTSSPAMGMNPKGPTSSPAMGSRGPGDRPMLGKPVSEGRPVNPNFAKMMKKGGVTKMASGGSVKSVGAAKRGSGVEKRATGGSVRGAGCAKRGKGFAGTF